MSILFRTRECLTVFELTRAWGLELPKGVGEPEQNVHGLTHILLQDIVNGHLDDSGPLRNDRRSGVGWITADYKVGFIEGHYFLGLVKSELTKNWCLHYIVVMKEAALDFARRREIPPPSWWADSTTVSNDEGGTRKAVHSIAASSIPAPIHSARSRGRRPKKFDQAKEAMHEDIRLGRLTAVTLGDMLEKDLAAQYGVSRDTARKARDAALSEMPPTTQLPSTDRSK